MTLPTLISKYEKHVIELGLQKTYSELDNVIRMAEAEHGNFSTWDFSGGMTSIINRYFAPYMNLTSCDNFHSGNKKRNTCFILHANGINTWYTPTSTAAPGPKQDTSSNYYFYNLDDGRAIAFTHAYFPNWATPGKGISIFVDVNGKRGRTVMGQDVFTFSINNFRGITNRIKFGCLESFSDKDSTEHLKQTCINSTYFNGSDCGYILQRNGWKFPKDYPIKF